MSKHTPGPWLVTRHNRASQAHASLDIDSRDGKSIAEIGLAPLDDSDEANARLIAAAPDLLQACQSLLAGRASDIRWAAIQQAQEAIDKATGRDTSSG